MSLSKVAIIGTGMTALSIGHYLPLLNPLVQITFFDKAQKSGGRVATRRSRQNQELLFDHGAPFLWEDNVKGDFRKVLDDLNAVKQITINITKTQSLKGNSAGKVISKNVLIGKNGLDSVPQEIFKSIKNIKASHFQHRVTQILQTKENQLSLRFEQVPNKIFIDKQMGPFNQVFCCIPFPQAKSIKQQLFSFEPYNKNQSNYNAHWIVLVSTKKGQLFTQYKDTDVIEFKNKDSPIKYAVKQNKKFQKLKDSEVQNWAVYLTDEWSEQNLNLSKDQVQEKFMKEVLPQYSEKELYFKPQFIAVHRWLYSSPKLSQVIKSPLYSSDKSMIFAGDWVGNRQSVGECWTLGKQIVEQLYGNIVSSNKSKL